MKPTPDTVLGIDQAANSGWCLMHMQGRVVVAHGVVKKRTDPRLSNRERLRIVTDAISVAGGADRLLVVFEDHSKISLSVKTRYDKNRRGKKPTRNTATFLGMGAARARWDDRLDDCDHPQHLRINVTMDEWRGRVLAMSRWRGSVALKDAATTWASALLGTPIDDDNEAEAIGIASWGCIFGVATWEADMHARAAKERAQRERKKQQVIAIDGEEIAE